MKWERERETGKRIHSLHFSVCILDETCLPTLYWHDCFLKSLPWPITLYCFWSFDWRFLLNVTKSWTRMNELAMTINVESIAWRMAELPSGSPKDTVGNIWPVIDAPGCRLFFAGTFPPLSSSCFRCFEQSPLVVPMSEDWAAKKKMTMANVCFVTFLKGTIHWFPRNDEFLVIEDILKNAVCKC